MKRRTVAAVAPSRERATLLVSLWLVAFDNFPFWSSVARAAGDVASNALFFASLPLFVLALVYLAMSLLAWGRATKPVLAAALLASAFAGFFIHNYAILIDHGMLANVLETDPHEAFELLSPRLVLWIAVFGVLPVLLLARARLPARGWKGELKSKLVGVAAALICLAGVTVANYAHYASILRNHRELRLLLVPTNMLAAVHGYVVRHVGRGRALEAVGADARRAVFRNTRRPMLVILVVGETARAANFSLNGYDRPTMPELARQGVVSFSDVLACGTSTAVSLPCMFLDLGRAGFGPTSARRHEGLLDVLGHAGVAVRWRDNNSGCKGICDRVPHEDLAREQLPGLCRDGQCYDGVLLRGLQAYLERQARDTFIVLHMKGSHGPAYHLRYPPTFRFFTPACEHAELDRCSRAEIVNAYDNTLRYTDHVLSETIELLRRNAERFDTAMVYVSDHGESLGEHGIYLHGFPYMLAPREQLHVPLLVWLSDEIRADRGIDLACLRARRELPLSHDNLFHSMLGLADIRTSVYRPELDLFHPCRGDRGPTMHAGLNK